MNTQTSQSGEPQKSPLSTAQETGLPNAQAYVNRGLAYGKDELDRAIADFTQAIRLDPKYLEAYLYRAVAYHNKGEKDRAITDYSQIIKLDPKFAAAYGFRGTAYQNRGDNDRAIADFTQAIRLDPKYAREKGIEQKLAALQKPQAPTAASFGGLPRNIKANGVRLISGRAGKPE
jgi:tetratricopeptide (TPR) repeat protein